MTATDSIPVVDERPAGPSRSVWVVIALLLAASFVMILNETVMSVALPPLMVEFDVSASTAQWLTTIFMLTMAVVIPITGVVMQRFSTRSVFAVSLTLFATGTLLAGIAPVFAVLVLARAVQAAGTALMLPLLMTTVMTFVPEDRRGRTMGLISIVIAVAPAIGPTVSGLLIDSFGWRSIFFVVLPIAVIALIGGLVLIRNITTPRAVRFDVLSVVLSALAFGGLIYGLSSIGESTEGHAAVSPSVPIVGGVVALALFVWRQIVLQRNDAALLDLRVFRERTFTIGLLMLLVAMASLFGSLILLPIYLQNVLGVSTLDAGLIVLPGGLVMGLAAPFVGRLYDRVGPRPLVIPGTLAVTVALGIMALFGAETSVLLVILAHVVLSIGLAFLMTPLMTSALGALAPSQYSHGSAILNTLQQLAGAAGTALFVTVMTVGANAALSSGADAVHAQATGIHHAFLVGIGVAAAAVILSFFMKKQDAVEPQQSPAAH